MPFNGSGTFNRTNGFNGGATTWVQDRDGAVKIEATRHDTHDQDLAAGLTNCITKDGQTTPTANIPMGGFKHVNVDTAAARNDYAAASQVQDSALIWGGTTGGTGDDYTISLSPALPAYIAGVTVALSSDRDSVGSGTATLNVNGLGTKDIKLANGDDLYPGAIQSGYVHQFLYDGTNFILLNPAESVFTWTPTLGTLSGTLANTNVIDAEYRYNAQSYGKYVDVLLHFTFDQATTDSGYISASTPTDFTTKSSGTAQGNISPNVLDLLVQLATLGVNSFVFRITDSNLFPTGWTTGVGREIKMTERFRRD
jgi:hypothetical protein